MLGKTEEKKNQTHYLNMSQITNPFPTPKNWTYRPFHGFGQAKFAFGGLILGSSQFSQLA